MYFLASFFFYTTYYYTHDLTSYDSYDFFFANEDRYTPALSISLSLFLSRVSEFFSGRGMFL